MNSDNENEREPGIGHVLGKRTLVYLGVLAFLFALFLLLSSGNASAEYVSEDITVDTTWDETGSPYILNTTITIHSGVTLTIEPNVTVMVDPFEVLVVDGSLVATGTPDKPITFTTNVTDVYWYGIVVQEGGNVAITNAIIEYAVVAIEIQDGSASVTDTVIRHCDVFGIYWKSTVGDIEAAFSGLQITDIRGWIWGIGNGISITAISGNVTFALSNCNVSETWGSGIVVQASGWIEAEISDTAVSDAYLNSGIILYSANGDIVAALEAVMLDSCGLHGIIIYAANGNAEVVATSIEAIFNAEAGVQVEGLSASLSITDSNLTENNAGLAVYADDGDARLDASGLVLVNNQGYGIVVNSWPGDIMLALASSSITNGDWALGVVAEANGGDLEAIINDVVIIGGAVGLDLNAAGDITLDIANTDLIANKYMVASIVAEGSVSANIDEVSMNGEEANQFSWYYPKEIDYEYAIINPDAYTMGSLMVITLPFAFPFGTNTYTTLYVYRGGYISVGSPYPYTPPFNMYYGSANLIVPCQDNYYYTNYPYMSYKIVGEDKIIIQWYMMSRSIDPWYLGNVFQAILYSNGDIQFNYANMDALNINYISYDYGLKIGSDAILLNYVWIPNVYDADYKSIYLTRETFAYYGMYVAAESGVEVSIANTTISHYVGFGLLFLCDNGDIALSVSNLAADHLAIGYTSYPVAIGAIAENGTISATITDSTFSNIMVYAIGFLSNALWGGEDRIEITSNTFEEVGWSAIVRNGAEDEDGHNEFVEYSATRTLSDNKGINSGGMAAMTYLWTTDSNWNITVEDVVAGNSFTGSPTFGYMLIIGGSLPLQGPMMSMIGLYYEFDIEYESANVDICVAVTGNSIESTGTGGISVYHEIYTNNGGSAQISSSVVVNENELVAPLETPFYGCVDLIFYAFANNADSDSAISSEISFTVVDNEMMSEDCLTIESYAIYVSIEQAMEYGRGNGSLVADVVIERNLVENADGGIGLDLEVGNYNQFGSQTVDASISISNNEIGANYIGIDAYITAYSDFSQYYPVYEMEVSSCISMMYAMNINNNTIASTAFGYEWWRGISIHTELYAYNYMSPFAHAALEATDMVSIAENTINFSSSYEWVDGFVIGAENYIYASGKDSVSDASLETSIICNAITISEGSVINTGIYTYDDYEAWTYNYDFSGAPRTQIESKLTIAENQIVGSILYGIEAELDLYSGYGTSMLEVDVTQEIRNNIINGFYWYGIDVELYSQLDQFIYDLLQSSAAISGSIGISIASNEISSDEAAIEASGISLYDYRYLYASNGYWTGEATYPSMAVEISSNKIAFAEDPYYAYNWGIYAYSELYMYNNYYWTYVPGFLSLIVNENTIEFAYDAIDAEGCNATITNNVITSAGDYGIYLWNCKGVVSSNEIYGGIYAYGIYVEGCDEIEVTGNTVDGCADGVVIEYSSNILVSGNLLINNGIEGGDTYGIAAYESYNVTIESNVITGNGVGIEIYYAEKLVIRENTINDNLYYGAYVYEAYDVVVEENAICQNGGDGLYLEYCYAIVVGNNTICENMGYGLYLYDCYATIYNGIYADNSDEGIFAWGLVEWIIDSVSEARNNDVYVGGDVTVVSGGVLTLDNVWMYFSEDWDDGVPQLTVEEGGKLIAVMSAISSWWWWEGPLPDGYHFRFEVYGALEMETSQVIGAVELYLAPSSDANIRASVVADNWRNGIHIDNCSPNISGTIIVYNGMDGIYIEGENAAPTIMDCLISMNNRGIYAVGANLANVIDNVIIGNYRAGIYVLRATGSLHDNILMFNMVEIYVKDSSVTVEDNQIGYSTLVDIMATYAPAFIGGEEVPLFGEWVLTPEMIASAQMEHIGIYAINSTVTASSNVYGLLTYAVYVADSTLAFSDEIKSTTLVLPYYDDFGTLYNITLPIFVYDGIYASKSSITVSDAYIEVVDDAIFLGSSEAQITNTVLEAGDFDLYLVGGSSACVSEVTFGSKGAKVLDDSVLTINYRLTVKALDENGQPMSGVWIVIYDADGQAVAEGPTDENGIFSVCLIGYIQTSAGLSAARTYTINASFDKGYVVETVELTDSMEVIVQLPVKEPIQYDPMIGIAYLLICMLIVFIAVFGMSTKP
ncbi:MAG: right-handed parallel beta-helix repeat-containing protein [Methanomassiliicoccales archaeon]